MATPLLRTTALRLALRYTLVYAAILALALGLFTWVTRHYAGEESQRALLSLAEEVQQHYETDDPDSVIEWLNDRTRSDDESQHDDEPGDDEDADEGDEKDDETGQPLFLLISSDGQSLGGNLLEAPLDETVASEPGVVESVWFAEEILPRSLFEDDAFLPLTLIQFDDGNQMWLSLNVPQITELQELTEYLTEVLGAAVILSLIMSVTIGRHILRRVETINEGAAQIMQGDLASRIEVSGRKDEFDALGERLNAMLDRIQQLIRGISEVTDNIAHDLRSPLTRLRNRLEVTLLESRSEEEYRDAMQQSIDDADGLIQTFKALLSIAQAEAGNHRADWTRVELCALVRDLGDLYDALAQEQELDFEMDADCEAWVMGSRHLTAQAIGNLLDNAMKFSPAGGRVQLLVAVGSEDVSVTVSDTGPGIAKEDWERAQERFVRLEASRNRPGNGLGLSMVRAVCQLHKATLKREDSVAGLTVRLTFRRDMNGKNDVGQ